jgi:hypothetical protein
MGSNTLFDSDARFMDMEPNPIDQIGVEETVPQERPKTAGLQRHVPGKQRPENPIRFGLGSPIVIDNQWLFCDLFTTPV